MRTVSHEIGADRSAKRIGVLKPSRGYRQVRHPRVPVGFFRRFLPNGLSKINTFEPHFRDIPQNDRRRPRAQRRRVDTDRVISL